MSDAMDQAILATLVQVRDLLETQGRRLDEIHEAVTAKPKSDIGEALRRLASAVEHGTQSTASLIENLIAVLRHAVNPREPRA